MAMLAWASLAQAAPVVVTGTTYRGWSGAYRISNKAVDVIVVPQIGRVMAFQFTGHPETNPFYNNRQNFGKPGPPRPDPNKPDTFPRQWINFGGDKLWPSAQAHWKEHQPVAGFPPDPNFDSGPYKATRLPNGIRLTGPVSPYFAVQVVREITLRPNQPRVFLRDTFVKSKDAAGRKNGFPIGIWSITQVRGDATVYLPLNKKGHFPNVGYASLGDKPDLSPYWKPFGDLLEVTRPSGQGLKVGTDNAAGWIACVLDGNLLFSEHFTRIPHGLYPDKSTNAQVYTNGDDKVPYIEMEVLDRMAYLKAGQTLSRTLSWHLQKLPRVPRNPAEARRLVKAAMRP